MAVRTITITLKPRWWLNAWLTVLAVRLALTGRKPSDRHLSAVWKRGIRIVG